MKTAFAALIAAATVAGCAATTLAVPRKATPAEVAQVKSTINGHLRAPGSATFQSVSAYTIENGENAFCVYVNSQNAFGGMTGFQPVLVNYGPGRSPLVYSGDPAAYECANLAGGRSARF